MSEVDSTTSKSVHLVSLGCAYNRVEAELMLGQLRAQGYSISEDPQTADVLVVNTCAFVDRAKEESIDTIVEMIEFKEQNAGAKLIVTGCLAERYGDDLKEELPEVDVFLGLHPAKTIVAAIEGKAIETSPSSLYLPDAERFIEVRGGSAYIRIAEGCNRSCSFCAVPFFQGKQRSRAIADIVREVQTLAELGIKEFALLCEDANSYGSDLGMKYGLQELLHALQRLPGVMWIRIHSLYPTSDVAYFEQLLKNNDRLVPYLDLPLQHISDSILRPMQRGIGESQQRALLEGLRQIDGLVLRSSLIVGFPGEGDKEFQQLMDWMQEVQFDHLDVFTYSAEENTVASTLPGEVEPEVAEQRQSLLLEAHDRIAYARNQRWIGQELEILVEGVSEEHEFVLEGRYYGQSLDGDGKTFLSFDEDSPHVLAGDVVRVEIDDATEKDLVGIVLERGTTR